MRPTRPERRNARRGFAAVEMLLITPVFLAALFGMIGIADLLIAEQRLAEASSRGARRAAVGGTREQVEEAVRAVLGDARFQHVTIRISSEKCSDPVPPGGLIEVRVELPARYATGTALAPVRADEPLVGRTVMQKE